MTALNKITEYFKNWNGEDQEIADVTFSTDDLRFFANLQIENIRLQHERKILQYLMQKHPNEYNNLLDEMAMDR